MSRFKEPSTWAGIALIVQPILEQLQAVLPPKAAAVASVAGGVLAIILRETGADKPVSGSDARGGDVTNVQVVGGIITPPTTGRE